MNAHQDAQDANLTPSPAEVASVPTVDAAAVLAKHEPTFPSWADRSVCMECRGRWRGNAETGGCEAVLLAREVVALRERAERAARILGEVQWSSGDTTGYCPVCREWCGRSARHAPGCRLAAALADGEG